MKLETFEHAADLQTAIKRWQQFLCSMEGTASGAFTYVNERGQPCGISVATPEFSHLKDCVVDAAKIALMRVRSEFDRL